jgi:hypothetical protein
LNIVTSRKRVWLRWRSHMRIRAKSFLTAGVVLVSMGMWAQESYHADVLARLSYDNSAIVQGEGVRHVCIALSPGGDYRIVRSLQSGLTERLQGKIPPEQFQKLRKLLESKAFRSLSGTHGDLLIVQESESFAAELPVPGPQRGEGKTQRLRWLNADGENPFPGSVATVVSWLTQFEPKDGKPFAYAEFQDVCPSVGLSLLQPSVAANSQP